MNTINSTVKGKAYEYACILALLDLVHNHRNIEVLENDSFLIARQRYENDITDVEKEEMIKSARAGMQAIIEMEPRILADEADSLTVLLQPDNVAQEYGDIRDVLIIRQSIEWEIGVSVKHNHAALKHSRLSKRLDFGEKWVNTPCSKDYFNEIAPIFNMLTELKKNGKKWSDMDSKEEDVYVPVLEAFKKEFIALNSRENITQNLVSYLIGSNGKDYYKLIHNNDHTTTIMPFNILGTLNQATELVDPTITVPKIELPTRIIELSFKENSKTTLILTMNCGWSISFRIHNASTKVEASLKFDIQLQSKPEDIFYLNRKW